MSTTDTPTDHPGQVGFDAPTMTRTDIRRALTGLVAGMFAAVLAATVVSNALPVILSDLGGSQSAYAWVVTAELLAMTAAVPLWGKLADLRSEKWLIQLALVFFLLGSLSSGLAQDAGTLIAARVLQGIGAGGVTALVQIVMASMIPTRDLGRYSGIFGAVFAGATVAGPLIGGLLVDTSWLGWRASFFLSVPLTVLAIVLLQRTLRLPEPRRGDASVDWVGAVLITAGVCVLLVWVTLAGDRFDWTSPASAGMVTSALTLLALAVWAETRASDPIVPLSVLRRRTVALTAAASALIGVSMYGGTVFLSQYFQVARGYTPTASGLLSLPMIFGLLVSSTIAGALISRSGRWKRYLVAGGVLMTVGFAPLATIDADTSMWFVSTSMLVLGLGLGLLVQNLVLAAQNDVPAAHLGATTSVLTFSRTLGGTVGVSVLGAILATRVTSDPGTSGHPAGEVPDLATLPPELLRPVQDAYAHATAELFLIAAPLAVLALVAVLSIREIPLKRTSGAQRAAQERDHTAPVT